MLTQRRATGGIWFSYGGAIGVIDPGPGSLVRACDVGPSIDFDEMNTIILTHKHQDHSCDVNVMIEAMTLHKKGLHGRLIIPRDADGGDDPVVLRYAKKKVAKIRHHRDGKIRHISDSATVESVLHSHHGVQCFGLIFRAEGLPTWGLISDSTALPTFETRYRDCEMLVINTTFPMLRPNIDHMSLPDVRDILAKISPKIALLSHMGRGMLDLDPAEITKTTSTETTKVIPGRDGLVVALQEGSR